MSDGYSTDELYNMRKKVETHEILKRTEFISKRPDHAEETVRLREADQKSLIEHRKRWDEHFKQWEEHVKNFDKHLLIVADQNQAFVNSVARIADALEKSNSKI